jgi:hypothetical protein
MDENDNTAEQAEDYIAEVRKEGIAALRKCEQANDRGVLYCHPSGDLTAVLKLCRLLVGRD